MEKVINQNPDKKYFTQVCNLIDELDLSPLAIALYLHYKRFSETGSADHPGVKFLMKKYRCSSPVIARAKKELEDHGLIRVTRFPAKEGRPDEIEILDIWARNVKHFQDEIRPVTNQQRVADPLPNSNGPVTDQQQPRYDSATAPLLNSNALNKEEEFKDFKNLNNGGGSTVSTSTSARDEPPPPPKISESPPKTSALETRADYLLRKQTEYPHFNVEQIYADFKRKCGTVYPNMKDSQRSFDKWLETQDVEFVDEKQNNPAFDEAEYFKKKYGGLKTNAA